MKVELEMWLMGVAIFFLPLLSGNAQWVVLSVGIIILFSRATLRDKRLLLCLITLLLVMHWQWGLVQYISQGDLELRLIGETILSPNEIGIAKYGWQKMIRPYGPYRHANSFGAAMLVGVIFSMRIRRINLVLGRMLILLFGIGIIISFSRAVWLGGILLFIFYIWRKGRKFDWRIVIGLLVVVTVFIPQYIDRSFDSEDRAIVDRIDGYRWSIDIIKEQSIWMGVGYRGYQSELKEYLMLHEIEHQPWHIDYVHSVPLLIIASLGLIPGLVVIAVIIWWINKEIQIENKLMIVSLLPLLLLDHYPITQAGPLLLLISTILL